LVDKNLAIDNVLCLLKSIYLKRLFCENALTEPFIMAN